LPVENDGAQEQICSFQDLERMSSRDWFRNESWDDSIVEEFEKRLKRSRSHSKPQYLRIQAHHLTRLGQAGLRDVAVHLLKRLLAEYPESFDAPAALEALADIYVAQGEYGNAEACYRQCLSFGPRAFSSGYTDLSLAEVLLASRQSGRYAEVQDLLDAVAARPFLFKMHIFRFYRAQAQLAARRGETDHAREYAKKALDIAADRNSDLPRHPTVGLVDESEDSLSELRSLARGVGESGVLQ
jgi:tetratricopeptide (TPR) repeat protein